MSRAQNVGSMDDRGIVLRRLAKARQLEAKVLRQRDVAKARYSMRRILLRLSPLQMELLHLARTGLKPADAKAAAAKHSRGSAHAQVASRALRNLVKRGLLECVGRVRSKSGHRYKLTFMGADLMRWDVNNRWSVGTLGVNSLDSTL
jgi:hypothetical protein